MKITDQINLGDMVSVSTISGEEFKGRVASKEKNIEDKYIWLELIIESHRGIRNVFINMAHVVSWERVDRIHEEDIDDDHNQMV
jgi:hypothetical protein